MYNRQSIIHSRINSSVPVHSPIQWQHPRYQTWRHHLVGPSGWDGGGREGRRERGEGRRERGEGRRERSKCCTVILSLSSNQPLPPHCVFAQCTSNQQTLAARPRPCQATGSKNCPRPCLTALAVRLAQAFSLCVLPNRHNSRHKYTPIYGLVTSLPCALHT